MTTIAAQKSRGILAFLVSAVDAYFAVPESRMTIPAGPSYELPTISVSSDEAQTAEVANANPKDLFLYGGSCCY